MANVVVATEVLLYPKLVEEERFLDFDFTDVFEPGVSIVTTSLSITRWSGNVDTDPNMAAMHTDPIHVVGLVASQLVKLGTPKCNYACKMTAQADNGAVESITLILPVVAKRAP